MPGIRTGVDGDESEEVLWKCKEGVVSSLRWIQGDGLHHVDARLEEMKFNTG